MPTLGYLSMQDREIVNEPWQAWVLAGLALAMLAAIIWVMIATWNGRGEAEVNVMDKPNTVSGVFIVKASTGYFDDEATVETLRYSIEQDLEDAGFDVDVKVLRKQTPLAPVQEIINDAIFWRCGQCGAHVTDLYCQHCGRKVDWDD